MLVTAVMSVMFTCTYTVCHLLKFYWFLFLINVTCLDFQGILFSFCSSSIFICFFYFIFSSSSHLMLILHSLWCSACFQAMVSPIFLLQPSLFIAAIFQFCFRGIDPNSILPSTSRLSHGPFSSETFFHYCFGDMRVIHPYCVASPLYHIITVAHYFVYHVICDLFLCKISMFTLEPDLCLIFEGVKRLSCCLAHRLHCI